MLDLTDQILNLINENESKYYFDQTINIGGSEYTLIGNIEFILETKMSRFNMDLPQTIEIQHCDGILDDLSLFDNGKEVQFVYTDDELMKVFEI